MNKKGQTPNGWGIVTVWSPEDELIKTIIGIYTYRRWLEEEQTRFEADAIPTKIETRTITRGRGRSVRECRLLRATFYNEE